MHFNGLINSGIIIEFSSNIYQMIIHFSVPQIIQSINCSVLDTLLEQMLRKTWTNFDLIHVVGHTFQQHHIQQENCRKYWINNGYIPMKNYK